MTRRRFLAGLGAGVLAAPLAVEAQPAEKAYRIGLMLATSVSSAAPALDAFRQGLRELGWVEGKNFAFEIRAAEGKYERLSAFAAEFVRLKVDVTAVGGGTPAVVAAGDVTRTIPSHGDKWRPCRVGARCKPRTAGWEHHGAVPHDRGAKRQTARDPQGSPPTGLSSFRAPESGCPHPPSHGESGGSGGPAARDQLQILEARSPEQFDGAFATMVRGRSDALLVLPDPMFFLHRSRLHDLAAKARLPAMFGLTEHAKAGGLMAYAASVRHNYYRAATYVDKVLKGAKPGDLPIEQPTKFELVINLKTAKTLGLTIPRSLLSMADEVIQ